MKEIDMIYVCSEGDAPVKVFFDDIKPFMHEYDYIDVFNVEGDLVKSYTIKDDTPEGDTDKSNYGRVL